MELASFKHMMQCKITNMRYSPTLTTWHTINHYMPSVGIPSYSYSTDDSLRLCDVIEKRLKTLDALLRDDLFLIGKIKTSEMIADAIAKDAKRKRRTPRYEIPTWTAPVVNDHHETIHKIHTEEEDVFEGDCESQDSDSDMVHESDELWLNDEELAELHHAQEKHVLNGVYNEDEWTT